MTSEPSAPSPADAWEGARVARWLKLSEGLERQLAPVSEVLFGAAALAAGERVIDVGCGTGPTTRQAAGLVGGGGAVTGLDVSSDMLAAAAGIERPEGSAPIDWLTADAVTWEGPDAAADPATGFDVVLSRFGVMFFSDPATAFATLARATRPGGRLAVAVWASRDDSEMWRIPLQAVLAVREAHGLSVPDGLDAYGGPFSLGQPEAATALLEGAGWSSVQATPHRLALPFSGGVGPEAATESAQDLGPSRIALDGLSDEIRAEALAAITATLADHLDASGHVVLDGAIYIITAQR